MNIINEELTKEQEIQIDNLVKEWKTFLKIESNKFSKKNNLTGSILKDMRLLHDFQEELSKVSRQEECLCGEIEFHEKRVNKVIARLGGEDAASKLLEIPNFDKYLNKLDRLINKLIDKEHFIRFGKNRKRRRVSKMYKDLSKNLPSEAFGEGGAIYLSDGMWLYPDGTTKSD